MKVFEEQRAMDPQEPIIYELVIDVPPPPYRSSRIFRPFERHMGMLTKKVKKIFLIGDKGHGDNPNTFDKTISDIDSEK